MKRINVFTLKMVRERSELLENKNIRNPIDAAEIIHGIFEPENEPVEIFGILALNCKNEVIGAHQLSKGLEHSALVSPRMVFKAALLNNAVSVLLFHNHPSGDTRPSGEDIEMTKRIVEAGRILGIEVLDHIITGFSIRNNYSMKANGYI